MCNSAWLQMTIWIKHDIFNSTGKMIKAAYVPLPTYHNLFPESVQATQLLMPIRRWSLEPHLFRLSLFNNFGKLLILKSCKLCVRLCPYITRALKVYVVVFYVQPFLFPFVVGFLTPYGLYTFQGLFSSTHLSVIGMIFARIHVQLATPICNYWISFESLLKPSCIG